MDGADGGRWRRSVGSWWSTVKVEPRGPAFSGARHPAERARAPRPPPAQAAPLRVATQPLRSTQPLRFPSSQHFARPSIYSHRSPILRPATQPPPRRLPPHAPAASDHTPPFLAPRRPTALPEASMVVGAGLCVGLPQPAPDRAIRRRGAPSTCATPRSWPARPRGVLAACPFSSTLPVFQYAPCTIHPPGKAPQCTACETRRPPAITLGLAVISKYGGSRLGVRPR